MSRLAAIAAGRAAPGTKAAIVGLAGPVLLEGEAALFRAHPPAGVILFARNVVDPAQLAALMAALRRVLPPDAVYMVDQEGGRVARLRPPSWRAHPPGAALGTPRRAWLSGALIGLDCAAAGFNMVAAPVLDLSVPGAHDVIGDRALAETPEDVARLGRAFAEGLLAAGVVPIGKHIPGHGRARVDSHLSLPVVEANDLDADLHPFGSRPMAGPPASTRRCPRPSPVPRCRRKTRGSRPPRPPRASGMSTSRATGR